MEPLPPPEASPHFSVLIPVRNRAAYLRHTLRSCMLQNYERIEFIVSDDGSTDNVREVVEDAARQDARIRYTTPGANVGMRDNFELVLRLAKPGYVLFLGGDDGIMPDGIRGMAAVLHETGLPLLAWPAPVYVYPGVRDTIGQLCLQRRPAGVRTIDSHAFLRRQAQRLHYLSDVESPMLYVKGVAATALVERVRGRSPEQRFFSCPTPDGYSGIVLAGEVSHYAFSGKPFTIYGQSPDSQGLAYLSNATQAKESSEAFVRSVASRPMHVELASQPYSPLIALMTADYLLTARDLPGWPGRFPPLDFQRLLVNGLAELTHGLYGEQRICRELGLLNRIAEQHRLGAFFRERVRRTARKRPRQHFSGTGINASALLLDGAAYGLHDIVEAGHAAQAVLQLRADLHPSSLLAIAARSLRYRLASIRRGPGFPPESDWA